MPALLNLTGLFGRGSSGAATLLKRSAGPFPWPVRAAPVGTLLHECLVPGSVHSNAGEPDVLTNWASAFLSDYYGLKKSRLWVYDRAPPAKYAVAWLGLYRAWATAEKNDEWLAAEAKNVRHGSPGVRWKDCWYRVAVVYIRRTVDPAPETELCEMLVVIARNHPDPLPKKWRLRSPSSIWSGETLVNRTRFFQKWNCFRPVN